MQGEITTESKGKLNKWNNNKIELNTLENIKILKNI